MDVTSRETFVTFYRVLLGRYVFAGFLVAKTTVKQVRVHAYLLSLFFKNWAANGLNMRWIVFTLIHLSLKLKKPIKIAKMSEFIHNLARGHMTSVCFLPSVVRHGRGKLLKRKVRPSYRHAYIHTYFIVTSQKGLFRNKCRYFHVPNLIPI